MNETTDPVCGAAVDPMRADYALVYDATTHYFCGPVCCEKFIADAKGRDDAVNSRADHETASAGASTIVPHAPSQPANTAPTSRIMVSAGSHGGALFTRFWVSFPLTLLLLEIEALTFFSVPEFLHLPSQGAIPVVEMLLATSVCVWGAWPLYRKALALLRQGRLTLDSVIGPTVAAMFVYGVARILLNAVSSTTEPGALGHAHFYLASSAVLVTVRLSGQLVGQPAENRAVL